MMPIRGLYGRLAILLFLAAGLAAQDTKFEPQGEQIPGPDNAQ